MVTTLREQIAMKLKAALLLTDQKLVADAGDENPILKRQRAGKNEDERKTSTQRLKT